MTPITTPRSSSGFTIIELIIATATVGVLLIPVSMVMLQFYGQALASSKNTHMAIESRDILSVISENLRTSSAVLQKNTITDTDIASIAMTMTSTIVLINKNPPGSR